MPAAVSYRGRGPAGIRRPWRLDREEFMRDAVLNQIGGIPDRLMNLGFIAERKPRDVTRDDYLAELKFYDQPVFRDQKQFLALPDSAPAFTTIASEPFADGEQLLLRYPSRYRARNPQVAPRLLAHANNRNGYLFVWRHPRAGKSAPMRPLVLCVHGFRMGNPKRAMAMFKVRKLYEMGMDVALFIQPHHWKRASSRFRQHFVNAEDVPLTLETVGQQIHDLHSCYLGLRDMGYDRIGMIGGSLGGMAVTLYATVSDAPTFIFSVVPAVRFDNHIDPARSALPFGKDEEVRERTFRALDLIDPSFYPCRFDLEHFGVVYHKGDKINEASDTEAWVRRWNVRHVTALAGGHWVVFDGKARGKAWYGWLARHGFCR